LELEQKRSDLRSEEACRWRGGSAAGQRFVTVEVTIALHALARTRARDRSLFAQM